MNASSVAVQQSSEPDLAPVGSSDADGEDRAGPRDSLLPQATPSSERPRVALTHEPLPTPTGAHDGDRCASAEPIDESSRDRDPADAAPTENEPRPLDQGDEASSPAAPVDHLPEVPPTGNEVRPRGQDHEGSSFAMLLGESDQAPLDVARTANEPQLMDAEPEASDQGNHGSRPPDCTSPLVPATNDPPHDGDPIAHSSDIISPAEGSECAPSSLPAASTLDERIAVGHEHAAKVAPRHVPEEEEESRAAHGERMTSNDAHEAGNAEPAESTNVEESGGGDQDRRDVGAGEGSTALLNGARAEDAIAASTAVGNPDNETDGTRRSGRARTTYNKNK